MIPFKLNRCTRCVYPGKMGQVFGLFCWRQIGNIYNEYAKSFKFHVHLNVVKHFEIGTDWKHLMTFITVKSSSNTR
jgi:hypothetical protein